MRQVLIVSSDLDSTRREIEAYNSTIVSIPKPGLAVVEVSGPMVHAELETATLFDPNRSDLHGLDADSYETAIQWWLDAQGTLRGASQVDQSLRGETLGYVYGCQYKNNFWFSMPQYAWIENALLRGEPGPQVTIAKNWTTYATISLCGFNEHLYAALHGSGGGVYILRAADPSKPENWSKPKSLFENWTTKHCNPLASFKGKLFMSFIGLYGGAYISSSGDGLDWPKPTGLFDDWEVGEPMSLAAFKDKLFLSFIGWNDRKVYLASSADGMSWPKKPKHISIVGTTDEPAWLAVEGGSIYMAVTRKPNVYIWQSSDGEGWVQWDVVDIGQWGTAPCLFQAMGNIRLSYVKSRWPRLVTFYPKPA